MANNQSVFKTIGQILEGGLWVGTMLITSPLSRTWYNRWGATDAELQAEWPGDGIVPTPKLESTHSITINAPASAIWPWVVQLGQGRGGWYSYDGLENIVGCDIHSAESILPEHQQVEPGMPIRFGPEDKAFPGQIAERVEPERALIMVGMNPQTQQPERSASWTMILDEQPNGTTRLLSRSRNDYKEGEKIMWRLVEPIAFVMERKMLMTIKRNVEQGNSQ